MTFIELVEACRERAPKDIHWSVAVEFDHHAHSDGTIAEYLKWGIWRADLRQHFKAADPQTVLNLAFPVTDLTEQMAVVGEPKQGPDPIMAGIIRASIPEPTDDDLAAEQAIEQDSADLANEVSRGPWPR